MIAIVGILLEVAILAGINIVQSDLVDVGFAFASVLIILSSFLVLASLLQNKRIGTVRNSIILGFLFRLFLLYFDIFGRRIFVLPQSGGDAVSFYYGAISYARYGGWTRGLFPKIMGLLFRVIGINRLYAQYLLMLLSIVSLVYLAYAMNELLISDRVKKRVFQIVCLLPHFAIVSSIFMRESIITMFLSISIYHFACWIRRKNILHFVFAAALLLPASAFHSGSIAVLVGYIVVLMLYDNHREKVHANIRGILLAVILLLGSAFLLSRNEEVFLGKFEDVESLEDVANMRDQGDSAYAQYVGNSNNIFSLILFTPLRMFYFLFSPLPWQWRGIKDIIMFFFSSLYYLTVCWSVFRVYRRKRVPNRGVVFALMLVAMATVFVFGWGVSNTGTAARHRDKLATMFALLWATSIDGLNAYKMILQDRPGMPMSPGYEE